MKLGIIYLLKVILLKHPNIKNNLNKCKGMIRNYEKIEYNVFLLIL